MKQFKYIYVLFFLLIISCDDLLEVEPRGEIIADQALKTPQDLQELLNSTYDVLRGGGGDLFGGRTQAFAEVMSDNIDGKAGSLNNADFLAFYNKTTSFFTGYTQAYFKEPHFAIYRANVLLENVDKVEGVSEEEQNRIEGEALFIRALCYFDLIRLFAQPYGYTPDNSHPGVALRTSPTSEASGRATVGEVYNQIVSDLERASSILPSQNSVYADEWAAKALLAKVYFHMHKFQEAYNQANDVLTNGPYDFNPNPSEYTERYSEGGSGEAIFKMVSTINDHRGPQFTSHFRSDGVVPPTLRISRDMYNVAKSDPNDIRGQNWYTIENEGAEDERITITKFDDKDYFDVPLITVTEVKFIRAEAAAELNNLDVALQDINDIRTRAGVSPLPSTVGKSTLLTAIRLEKRKEFVAEGVRFHDLRRIGAHEGGDLLIRGARWDCPGMAVQFPDTEIAGAGGAGVFTPNPEGGCN